MKVITTMVEKDLQTYLQPAIKMLSMEEAGNLLSGFSGGGEESGDPTVNPDPDDDDDDNRARDNNEALSVWEEYE